MEPSAYIFPLSQYRVLWNLGRFSFENCPLNLSLFVTCSVSVFLCVCLLKEHIKVYFRPGVCTLNCESYMFPFNRIWWSQVGLLKVCTWIDRSPSNSPQVLMLSNLFVSQLFTSCYAGSPVYRVDSSPGRHRLSLRVLFLSLHVASQARLIVLRAPAISTFFPPSSSN